MIKSQRQRKEEDGYVRLRPWKPKNGIKRHLLFWKDTLGCNRGIKVVAGRILRPGTEGAEPRRKVEEAGHDGGFERQDTAL